MWFLKSLVAPLAMMTLSAAVIAQEITPAVKRFAAGSGFCQTLKGGPNYVSENVSVQFSVSLGRALDSMPKTTAADGLKTIATFCETTQRSDQNSAGMVAK